MSYRARISQTGKRRRGVRVKKAMFEILENHPHGICANKMFDELQQSNAKKFVSNPSQVAQVMRTMKGVISEDGTAITVDGKKYDALIYTLRYPEDFLEWLGE